MGVMPATLCARDLLTEDFLLLESDIVYEANSIIKLLQFPADNAVLISGPTSSGDEVQVAAKGMRIVGMSKDPDKFNAQKVGELVGITKVSQSLFEEMIVEAEIQFDYTLQVAYETDCLSAVSARSPVFHCLIPDLIWLDIDTPSDMRRSQETVYPDIIRKVRVSGKFEISPSGQLAAQANANKTT